VSDLGNTIGFAIVFAILFVGNMAVSDSIAPEARFGLEDGFCCLGVGMTPLLVYVGFYGHFIASRELSGKPLPSDCLYSKKLVWMSEPVPS
jgi:hypothetical protein